MHSAVPDDETRQKRGAGGKHPLLDFCNCFDKSTEMPSSGECASMKQKKDQSEREKKEAEQVEIH